jgi:ferredoxin
MHPAKESKVLDFANRHGSLFEPFAGSGEDVSAWFHEIETMHHLMLLWDAIDHKLDALASIIHWDHNTREVEYRGPLAPGPQIIASAYDIHPAGTGIASRFRPGDLVGPARHVFRIKLNEQLERYPAASRLLFKDNRYDSLLLCIVPGSLISALWLQFARAVQEGKTHRQCEQCGRWFEVMPEKLEGGKYCRNACRTKAYRLRIEEARKLRAAGMSVKKIAEKLGSDEKTVKGWTRK